MCTLLQTSDLDIPRQYHRYQTERVLEITPRTGMFNTCLSCSLVTNPDFILQAINARGNKPGNKAIYLVCHVIHLIMYREGLPRQCNTWYVLLVVLSISTHIINIILCHCPTGFFGRVYDFFLSQLYKLGSLLYLAVTAIICLDVIILHR